MSSPPLQNYTIGGVKVVFPCKAYPTQLSMMSMIIKGIDRKQNCLLESPTGSGKSLALLCSSLAWQHNEYEKRDREEKYGNNMKECDEVDGNKPSVVCVCNCSTLPKSTSPSAGVEAHDIPGSSSKAPQEKPTIKVKKVKSEDDDEEFKPEKKRFRTPVMPAARSRKHIPHRGIEYEENDVEIIEDDNSPNPHKQANWDMKLMNPQASCTCPCHTEKTKYQTTKGKEEKTQTKRIPKIYFGTRTHKQIAQIIRELKKTVYKDSRMTILGSREYTCVHPFVSKGPNKNDACNDLLTVKNGQKCDYYTGTHKIKQQWQIQDRGFKNAWDIEDLCKLGKKIKACPYFASRALKDEADIIFCPYNYLIDPVIRESMEIYLKDQVLVLDEAHNIEDSAREAASYSVTLEQLQEACDELTKLAAENWRLPSSQKLKTVCNGLIKWITNHSENLRQIEYNRAQKVFSGQDIDGLLFQYGVCPASLPEFQTHVNVVTAEEDDDGMINIDLSLSSGSGRMLKGLFIVIKFLFKHDRKYMRDYKIALIKTMEKKRRRRHGRNENRWLTAGEGNEAQLNTTLHFWCLNPAVAFSDFGSDVRSIILTSGTLSPMTSFASELGVNFPIQLEANHVIHKSQVWVGTVALGPNGNSLNASYRNAETFAFQDDIGRFLLHVCNVIPYGVLCFLPSYGMLSKLMDRWQTTGTYAQLNEKKTIVIETRGGDKTEFDEQLRDFYQLIEDCENTDLDTQETTGGLFFAVCRGKVSEGMDFADNNARAVITIGIPFPSFKDTQVELKRAYNDQHASSRGLLTGSEWYEIQAYRALNQALGRCIRHKQDWGALILVDERYYRNPKKYISGLSKWVRGKVNHHIHSQDAISSLSEFAQARQLKPCPEIGNASLSSPPSTPTSVAGPSKLAITAAGLTPSEMTTPSIKKEPSGYTPIVNTPARQQGGSAIDATPKLPCNMNGQIGRTLPCEMQPCRNASTTVSPVKKSVGGTATVSPQQVYNNSVQQVTTMQSAQSREHIQDAKMPIPESNVTALLTPMNKLKDSSPTLGYGVESNIPTPKAKLDFVEPVSNVTIVKRTSKEQIKTTVQPLFAKKLQRFAHKSASDSKTEQCNKGGASKFYQFVDLKSSDSTDSNAKVIDTNSTNQDGCQTNIVATETNNREQTLEQYRMSCNQTPPLFDTEESENTVIPESPERNEEREDIVIDESPKKDDRKRKRKLDHEDVDEIDHGKDGKSEETLGEQKCQKGPELGQDKKRVNRGSRLSRRRSEQKTPTKEQCDEKDDIHPNEDIHQVSVRRSARRRQDKGKLTSNDFLDTIGDDTDKKNEKCVPPCRNGLFCLHCGEGLSADLRDVEAVCTEDLPGVFLKTQAKKHSTKSSKRSTNVSSCQCHTKKSSSSKPASEQWLVARKELLKHCEPVMESTRVQKGITLNAHWSDEDQSCYRPVTCGSCPQGFIQLGYEVLATNNSEMVSGAVWFPPHSVGFCHQVTIPNTSDQ